MVVDDELIPVNIPIEEWEKMTEEEKREYCINN